MLCKKSLALFFVVLARLPSAFAMEPQTSVYCMRDLLKTILVNSHRTERLVRPTQEHILRNAKAFKGATREEQVAYLVNNVQGLVEEEARAILAIADEYPNRAPNARVVFGGSRVRGNSRPESDLDLGFFGFGRNQVDKIIKKINARNRQGILPIPVETTKIYEMNETPFIPLIRSPEEFFMRAGEGWSAQGKMKDFTPSGFISIGMDGTIVHVPPPPPPTRALSESASAPPAGVFLDLSPSQSGWVRMYEKQRSNDFNQMLIKKEGRYFEPNPDWNGPATIDKQLPKIVMDLDRRSLWPEELQEQFRLHYRRGPTHQEVMRHYETRIEMYEDAIRTIGQRLKDQDAALAREFERYFETAMKDIRKRKAKIVRGDLELLKRMDVRLSGVLGELRAVISVGKVREIGRRFLRSDVIGPAIAPRLAESAAHLASDPAAFEVLAKKFPAVFTPPKFSPAEMVEQLKDPVFRESYLKGVAERILKGGVPMDRLPNYELIAWHPEQYLLLLRNDLEADPALFLKIHHGAQKVFPLVELPASKHAKFFASASHREAYLKEVRNFIESKEADLILDEGGGRYAWVEVKNNFAPLSSEGFRDASFGKSTASQLAENLQVLDYLGIKDRVRVKFFVNGMEPALTEELKMKGVEVFQSGWVH